MPYPWTDLRLTQAAEAAVEHGCASAVDVGSLVTEIRRLKVEVRATKATLDLRTEERDRLVLAVKMLGGVEHFAECPCCLAERTSGEWHSDDCPMVLSVKADEDSRAALAYEYPP